MKSHAKKVFLMVLLFFCSLTKAQVFSGSIVNSEDQPVSDAVVTDMQGTALAVTGKQGGFSFSLGPQSQVRVQVKAPGYETETVSIRAGSVAKIVLMRQIEQIVVTAYRTPMETLDSPASERVLDQQQLREGAAPGLAGKLRQVPGLELFRRSSELVANPTSQGISLRGLGSTAASRTLVLSNDVPLNDPYGGWIHWEELPEIAVHSVEVVRGGASDLYGSSAIGGVMDVVTERPGQDMFSFSTSYGSEGTADHGVLASAKRGPWDALVAAGMIGTDGYILVAPALRGPIDRPSNVHAQNGLVEIERTVADNGTVFLRGSGMNEARDNGTPLQKNGTRLWRYSAGADTQRWTLRFYGSTEHYRQTFSSVRPDRMSETLTRYAEDPADELGASLRWRQPAGSSAILMAGADTHDVRASDDELIFASRSFQSTTARQRQTGLYGEALATPANWTLSASARVDHFSNFDAMQWTSSGRASLPSFDETVLNPRLGISRRITPGLALHALAFRAYRAPTENELYRTGQVGQQTTLPNPNLRSERATGWEAGFQTNLQHWNSMLRVSYFWTQVNRPITALTLQVTSASALLRRENLGQIESRGVSVDYELHPLHWASLTGGYQYADATVTRFDQQPQLIGKWIPQVARNMATAQLRLTSIHLGVLSFQGRISGRQFDDDANRYLLHGYFRFDMYASHEFGHHMAVFAAGENLLDRSIEVGKTPVLTLAAPRTARAGLLLRFGE